MSQTIVTVDVGGTGANNANAALTNLGALPTFGGSISGNLNVAGTLDVTGNANLGSFILEGNSIITTLTGALGDILLVPNSDGKLLVQSQGLFGNVNGYPAETYFISAGIDGSTVALGSVADSNSAAEVLAVNKNSGTLAYSEFIALNDSGDQDQGWISIGINSSNYNDPEYTLTGPDDGYVLFEAPQGTSANGDLIIGTGSYGLNNKIVMAAGGFTPTDAQLIIAPADLKRANLISYTVSSNVVIFTTDITHTFVANDIVAISDVGAPYDGTRTITDVSSNTFNVSVTTSDVGPVNLSPAGFALQFLPFNKGTVELTAQLFVGENSRSIVETNDITLAEGHAIPLGIVVTNDGPGQTVMINKSNGALAYSEYIAHNDTGNVIHGWISMGINSSNYDDPEFPITKADDGYLLFEPPEGTTGDGDLIIGTGTFGQKNRLIFAAEGFDEANAQMIITPNESVRISIATDSSSVNTGALQVVGGVGIQGSMYVQGNQTIQGDLIVNGSQVIQSINELTASAPISLLSDGNIANTWDQGIVGTYAISKSAVTEDIAFKEIANNTATLTTSNNHSFLIEDYVLVANVDATFDGTHRITAVTSNTFSYFKLSNNVTQTAATGTGTVDKAARYTGAVKRASDGAWRFFSNLSTRPTFNTDFTDANLVYDSIIAGEGTFNGSLKLGSPNTATISYSDANNRTFTIPAVGGDRTFAFINQEQTFTANQSFNSVVTATKFVPTAGDATGNGLYLSGTNKLGLTADGVERMSISASETVINDGSADYDFRVESDGNANMLFVDGGNNRVGIGTGSPELTLHVQGDGYVSGNVGIGTTNPTSNLHVIGSANVTTIDTNTVSVYTTNNDIFIQDITTGTSSTDAGILIRNKFANLNSALFTEVSGQILSYGINILQLDSPRDTSRVGGIFRLDTRTGGFGDGECFVVKAQLVGGNTELNRLVINLANGDTSLAPANGNVAIGTSTPTSKLHVIGTANITSTSTFGDDITLDKNDTSPTLRIQNRSSSTARFPQLAIDNYGDSNGMGVVELRRARGNSASPASVQSGDLLGGFNTWGHNGGAFISATRINSVADSTFSTSVNAHMQFLTTSAGTQAERLRIAANGNVGIGTVSPNQLLDVNGVGVIRTRLTVGNSNQYDTQGDLIAYGSGKNTLIIQTPDNSQDRGLAFRNAGGAYVGHISITNAGSNLGNMIFGVSDFTYTSVDDVNERMRITSSGNVGIGTTSPGAKVQIDGNSDTSDEDCMLRIVDRDTSSGSQIPTIQFLGGSSANQIGALRLNDQLGFQFRNNANSTIVTFAQNGNIYTEAGSAISYGSGETYQIWNDEDEVGVVSSDANWKNMKTFVCSKSGSLKFKFSAYISSGTYYFGWRILKNGSTVLAVNSFAGGLDAGESQAVHAYRRFVVSIGPIAAGDSLVLQMASTGGDAVPVTGNGQTLYAKEFRAYSTVPNVEHGGSTNIWGARVGIGTTNPSNAQLVVTAQKAHAANTYFAARFNSAGYNDTGSYTTMLGLGVEAASWSKGAIGFTRTTSYDVGYLGFYVNNDGGGSSMVALADEKMRITNDGYLRMASGTGGIQFNGDTSAANALDDYEEGTWSPVLTDGTNNVSLGTGRYTKIGRFVKLDVLAYNVNVTSLIAGNWLKITGVPFAQNGNNPVYANAIMAQRTPLVSGIMETPGSTTLTLYVSSNAVDYTFFTRAVWDTPSSMTFRFYFFMEV